MECYNRFRIDIKTANQSTDSPFNGLTEMTRFSWRSHFGFKILPDVTIRQRVEVSRVHTGSYYSGSGFLFFTEAIYKPVLKNYDCSGRLQFFDISNYDARIYAYEPDVLFNSTTHVIDGKGWRYLFVLHHKFPVKNKKFNDSVINLYLKWSQTILPGKESIGSGLDEIAASHKSEIKFQLILSIN